MAGYVNSAEYNVITNGSLTFSFNAGAGSNMAILVAAGLKTSTSETATSVTFGGKALAAYRNEGTSSTIRLCYLGLAMPNQTNDLVISGITFANLNQGSLSIASYSGIGSVRDHKEAHTGNPVTTATITSKNLDVVVSALAYTSSSSTGNSDPSVADAQNQRQAATHGTGSSWAGSGIGDIAGADAGKTVSWNIDGDGNGYLDGFSLEPGGGSNQVVWFM